MSKTERDGKNNSNRGKSLEHKKRARVHRLGPSLPSFLALCAFPRAGGCPGSGEIGESEIQRPRKGFRGPDCQTHFCPSFHPSLPLSTGPNFDVSLRNQSSFHPSSAVRKIFLQKKYRRSFSGSTPHPTLSLLPLLRFHRKCILRSRRSPREHTSLLWTNTKRFGNGVSRMKGTKNSGER